MYEFISNLNKNEYENFVINQKYTHFMQSYTFGQIKKEKNFIPHYVGLKKDNKIIATALLLEKKMFKHLSYFYSPRGFIIDYNNYELIEIFTKYLKKYVKENNGIYIKIDPAIKLHNLDCNGNIIDNKNNYELINQLKNMGYKHLGYNKGFEHEQPRFTYRLNLEREFEEIYNGFHQTTKKIISKGNENELNLYIGNEKDINDFYITMKYTAEREKIIQSSIKYYNTFYELFNKNNQSDLYIIKADIKKIRKKLNDKINMINEKINNISSENKKNELKNQLKKLNKELNEINQIKDEEITLSSIITVKFKDMVWTVHGGNNTKLMNLNVNYLLYYQIIEDAHKNKFKYIDFFGTCGDINPNNSNPISGLHNFKKRFGGEYTEFIGEFDYVINKPLYYAYKILIPIYRKIKRNFK